MESSVLLQVPEVEALVGGLRAEGDPAATRGVPAHVTLLYPFLPAAQVDEGVVAELEWFFAGVDGFDLEFRRVGRLAEGTVVHLAPEPADVLTGLTRALALRWPTCPPYGGRPPLDELVPHLTVVAGGDVALRDRAVRELPRGLPVRATVVRASLWTSDASGAWSERAVLPLAPPED